MPEDVWVLAEYNNNQMESITWEMLNEGQRLAAKLEEQTCVCLLGYHAEEYIDALRDHGTEKVYLVDNVLLSEYSLDAYTFALEKLVEKYNPSLMMIGATSLGSELAPRIAARLKLPCITEVKKYMVNEENLVITKSGYSDKVYIDFDFVPDRTVITTILPGDMDSEVANESREIEVIKEDIHIKQDIIRTRNLNFIKGDPRKIRLEEAEKIMAVGKGVDHDNLQFVEELADLLGASIGGTRPVVDDGLISFDRQIGITGKSVTPKLLIACGISGAREFVSGMEKTMLTIAINNDANARIFNTANMGILGDINELIPALTKKLKEASGKMDEESVY
ncbi:MAG: electron transfer flavoprotein subunit alpha/FixB family protein [Armatimonadetes bacterium]|nr:electron transfer flavoprotein subunit alpha/FixB family protein [Armatimonadota bacterium]